MTPHPDRRTGKAGSVGNAGSAATSVRSACQALEQLERSLLAGGFRDGATAYTRMAEVILAQRMFVADGDPALLPLYEELGELARRLFGLLHPYDTVMRQLVVLAPADTEPHRARVVAVLGRRGRRGASALVLARECSLSAADTAAALRRLEGAGTVRVRTPGAPVPAYVLVEAPPQQRAARTVARRDRAAASRTPATTRTSRRQPRER